MGLRIEISSSEMFGPEKNNKTFFVFTTSIYIYIKLIIGLWNTIMKLTLCQYQHKFVFIQIHLQWSKETQLMYLGAVWIGLKTQNAE